MNAAAGFSLPTVSLRVLLFCVLTPCAVLSAAQSPQTDSQQQTPAAAASSEVRTTQQSAPAPLAKTPTSDATSEVDAHPSVPFESHVNLVPVRVVVHDSSGKVVTNLTKEDFRLFQDRRAQTISVFTVETPASTAKQVVRGEATGEPVDTTKDLVPGTLVMPTRFVALLFDDVHLKMQDLLQARVAAMHYLDSSIDPSERVAIFTTSGQTQVDFTDDRAKIRAVVAQLMPHLIGAYDPTEDIDQCPQMGYYEADEILNKNDQNAIAAATADAAACLARTALSGIEDPSLAVQRSAQEMLLYGDTNAEYATRRLVEVVRRMSALPGQRSIVLISPGFLIKIGRAHV